MHFYEIISWSVTFLGSGFAIWKGGSPERFLGIVLGVGSTISAFVSDYRWMDVQYGVLTIDLSVLCLFGTVALFSDRWWPLWLTGIHALGVVLHMAFWVQPKIMSLVYMTALNIIGYGLYLTLTIGVLAHMRRQAERQRGAS